MSVITDIKWGDRFTEFRVGGQADDGRHIRDVNSDDVFTFSIYARALHIGQCDRVVCGGIADYEDATRIATMLNDGPIPA